jgi:hypothetical protein
LIGASCQKICSGSVPFYYDLSLENSSLIFLTLENSFENSFPVVINCGNSSGLWPLEKHWVTWRQIGIGACCSMVKRNGHRKVTSVFCSGMETLNGTDCCSKASGTCGDHRGSMIGVYYKENKIVHDQVSSVNCNGPSEQVSSLGTSALVSPGK